MPTMPNTVGLLSAAAQAALQSAGVLVPASIGYFGVYPVSIFWQRSALPPTTVIAQSPASGNTVAANASVILTCAEFPFSVAFP